MYGIFRESLAIFQNYGGKGLLFLLYAASVAWLFFREHTRWKRIVFLYAPLTILVLFFVPVSRIAYVALLDEGTTYYRILWLIPFSFTCAYAGAQAFSAHRRIGLAVCAALVVLCGVPVYKNVNISRAQNAYHLPQTVIDLCDAILPDSSDPYARVYAAFPAEMVHFVRQYDSRIILPFGREVVEPAWNHWNPVHTAMEEADVIAMEELTGLLTEGGFDIMVLKSSRATDKPPEEAGWERMLETGGYVIYRYAEDGGTD